MLDPGYNSYAVLDTLLALEKEKLVQIDRHITTLEYLKRTGATAGLSPSLIKTALYYLEGHSENFEKTPTVDANIK